MRVFELHGMFFVKVFVLDLLLPPLLSVSVA
jgi:hypothetical protein